MTISIGFICKNSIVLAADSQGSFEGSTHKQTNVDKLVEFPFRDGYAVCVMADSLEFFEMFRELMERRAAKTKIANERSIPDAFEKAMFDLKETIKALSLPIQRSRERMDHLFAANNFEVLIGFYFRGVPCLCYGNFVTGRVRKVNADYQMIGMPMVLVDYIMDGVEPQKMTNTEGLALAAYVIEAAKEHDSSCSGITRMALIKPESPMILSQAEIRPFVMAAVTFEYRNQREWIQSLANEAEESKRIFDANALKVTRPRRLFENPSSEPRPSSPKPGQQPPPPSQA